jgi:hypothetical protein
LNLTKTKYPLFLLIIPLVMGSCRKDEKLFTITKGNEVGIDFKNTIVTTDTFNALSFEYVYNGSGVGVADFNGDGLTDLFFGANQVSSRLYLNKGNFTFEDITEKAGVSTHRWITGVSVADINRDGLPDIYLCVGGETSAENRRNILFVNEGLRDSMPVFREAGEAFGLNASAYTTMAAFFDYDKDGDLDVYLVNNWLENFNRNNVRPKRVNGEAESTDQLFRNNGDDTFTDVSREAGILIEGYGLGVAICDINEDSWPDVYVANDFLSNDLLWINQGDGTFENRIGDYLKHQTHNGMGVDIADFNNDARPDIMVVDMLPPGHVRQKMMTPGQNYDHFHMALDLGYQPQYMRNTLQLNRGKMPDGRILFSEISFLSGVAQTDWSWAPLFADFDNDGLKDIFIANGYRRDVTNLDFVFFAMDNSPFGTPDARERKWRNEFKNVPDVKLSNCVYRNTGSLVFEDMTKKWGVDLPTFSNGTAYADLDNDGDLDLVTNNIDQEVILYENHANDLRNGNHFLRLACADTAVLNEKIEVYTGEEKQYIELTPYRGFQSTVENVAHFGLGEAKSADSIIIRWPDRSQLKFINVPADTLIWFSREKARPSEDGPVEIPQPQFETKRLPGYEHTQYHSDIKITRTLMHELSEYGPCLATGDANGDGLDDFFTGSESATPGRLFIQQRDGGFKSSQVETGPDHNDGSALFFDADDDGDEDLYLGKVAANGQDTPQPHRLYKNDGSAKFTFAENALPKIVSPASCVEPADFDGDGDLDLFVGGRIKPGAYPYSPRTYLLRNDDGIFTDVTASLNPLLMEPGMISSALWADINNDHRPDLIFTGEWQPVRIFQNDGKTFTEITSSAGLDRSNGWWNCIRAADLNGDGFMDLVAGNTGKNSFFHPTIDHPVQLVTKDFDGNGSVDPIMTYYNPVEKDRFIVHNRLVLIDQIPAVKRRFETFTQYATRPFEKAFTKDELKDAYTCSAYVAESAIFINTGGKTFTLVPLPDVAQLSTVNDVLIDDVNHDGHADIIAVGNMYAQETLFGRYDASLGTILLGDGKLNWKELSPQESGFVVDGDARNIKSLRTAGGVGYVVTVNHDSIQLVLPRRADLIGARARR